MKYYRGLWAQLRKAKGLAEADRKPLHAQLGLPVSSKDFTKENFDEWKRHVLAETKPDIDTQIAQIQMPKTRKLVFIGHLLSALEEGQEHAEWIVRSMREKEDFMRARRRGDGRMGRSHDTLEQLGPRGLDAVRNALKDECRKRWETKDHLLGEIQALRAAGFFDEVCGLSVVMAALNVETPPSLNLLPYEDLLVALSALRRLAGAEVIFPPVESAGKTDEVRVDAMDVPF
jgi:hypothetical protein